MTGSRIFLSAAFVLAFSCPAGAQMYPGQGVSVNPAASRGTHAVVYPGGQYIVLPPLLEPGEPYPGSDAQPIQLHPPQQQRVHRRAVVRREQAPQDDVASVPAVETPQPAVRRQSYSEPQQSSYAAPPRSYAVPPPTAARMQAAAPPPRRSAPAASVTSRETQPAVTSGGATSIPFSFGGPAVAPAAASQPRRQASIAAPPAVTRPAPPRSITDDAAAAPRTETASIATISPPAITRMAQPSMTPGEEPPNLSKRSEVLFPHSGADPTPQTLSQLKQLAGDLNSALDAGARKIQLDAFGGAPGDKSSDARRVSLHRALVIRQLLIDDGVPASRIDVRAMGGIDDNGNADRVDVYVRAG